MHNNTQHNRTVYEITPDELFELKQVYLDERNEKEGNCTSWNELANADTLVSDKEIFQHYHNFTFCADDFFCNCNE